MDGGSWIVDRPRVRPRRFTIHDSRITTRAFTLVELLVVIGIIGLLAAMSIPAFTRYNQQMRLKTASQEAIGLLGLARQLAMSSRQERNVLIDPEAHELVIEETLNDDEPKRVRLPVNVTVALISEPEATPPWRVTFEPSGGLGGRSATLTLTSQDKARTITVVAATGFASLQ